MFLHMIIEQTYKYKKRMIYNTNTDSFDESDYDSLTYVRSFRQPYGWIKESGTPPDPHWDVILMTDKDYELGNEIEIKIIGVFKRNDGDFKFIAVENDREIDDYNQLSHSEKDDLSRLYPRIDIGEGWLGKDEALHIYENCNKAL